MAIGTGVVWEIRPTATPGNINSGGFDPSYPGVDYSQQDASQYNGTDLASANGNVNPAVVTSASHSFDTADEGNLIYISAGTGWTPGRYKIVSTAGGAATLDRAAGTSAAISGGTYRVGGALSLGAANDSTTLAVVAAQNKVWIKSGTYILGAALSGLVAGSSGIQTQVKGYTLVRGDECVGDNRPTLDAGTFNSATPNIWRFENLIFKSTGGGTWSQGTACASINCKFYNSGNSWAYAPSTPAIAINCEMVSTRGTACSLAGNALLLGCHIHSSSIGVQMGGSVGVVNCLISGCFTRAVSNTSTAGYVVGCTIYGSESKMGTGFYMSGSNPGNAFLNNILCGLAVGSSNTQANQTVCYDDYNSYFNNTTDVSNMTKGAHSIAVNPSFLNVGEIAGTTATLSGLVLTDLNADFSNVVDGRDYCYIESGTGATVGNYKIMSHTQNTLTFDVTAGTNATANKVYRVITGKDFKIGHSLKGRGFPGTFQGLSESTGYMDIGAVQMIASGYSKGRVVNK